MAPDTGAAEGSAQEKGQREEREMGETYSLLQNNSYFTIMEEEGSFISFMSRNTGHCWMIVNTGEGSRNGCADLELFHKYGITIPAFHYQKKVGSVSSAIKYISRHDEYILRKANEKNMRNRKMNAGRKPWKGASKDVSFFILKKEQTFDYILTRTNVRNIIIA